MSVRLLQSAVSKFALDLRGYTVLTEAASGNYICTPLIAAIAGARVFAYGKDSVFGTYRDVEAATNNLAKSLGVSKNLIVTDSFERIPFYELDIVTNTGHLRPIDQRILPRLKRDCVIPLMYEPWEFRKSDIDIALANRLGVSIVGTDEGDTRLRTQSFIGYTVLYFMLHHKKTPFTSKVLLLGSRKFNNAIQDVLIKIGFEVVVVSSRGELDGLLIEDFNVIVPTEIVHDELLIGNQDAWIDSKDIKSDCLVIHIAGKIDVRNLCCRFVPDVPAGPTKMSFTTDFIDPIAVYDLHAAGLKVAEGMLKAKSMGLKGYELCSFVTSNYPAIMMNNDLPNQ
jgi:hypothetical protein